MIIKRKKNCKIIYYNKNYYLEGAYFFRKYKDKNEVYKEYENYKRVVLPDTKAKGRVEVELYEEDYKLILEALSNYKYIINKFSFLHKFDSDKVFQSNFDIDFLYQILETIYTTNFVVNKKSCENILTK